MAKLYLVNIKSIKKEDIKDLSAFRIEKASSFVNEKDKKLSLAAGIALNRGLEEFGLIEKDLVIKTNDFGKPYFKDYPNIKFNLSHSIDTSICVISSKEVGCDIEKIRKYNEKIINKCFSKEEKEFIEKSSNIDDAYTRIWTLKESFFKAIGSGLNFNMNEVSIVPYENNVVLKQNLDQRIWKLNEIKINNNYIAICEEDF